VTDGVFPEAKEFRAGIGSWTWRARRRRAGWLARISGAPHPERREGSEENRGIEVRQVRNFGKFRIAHDLPCVVPFADASSFIVPDPGRLYSVGACFRVARDPLGAPFLQRRIEYCINDMNKGRLEKVCLKTAQELCAGISVRISDQGDVYVNYLGDEHERHTSHHASGELHHKVGKRYVKWTGGLSGAWEPMKTTNAQPATISERTEVAAWGWQIFRIPAVLPRCDQDCGFIVGTAGFPVASTIGLQVSIVNDDISVRSDILGFPVVARYRFAHAAITVEIEAFLVDEQDV